MMNRRTHRRWHPCRDAEPFDPCPVVSLRSTTGYTLGCLRHPPSVPRAISEALSHTGGTHARHDSGLHPTAPMVFYRPCWIASSKFPSRGTPPNCPSRYSFENFASLRTPLNSSRQYSRDAPLRSFSTNQT